MLCQLTGRRDFLYVADSKLATRENMAYLHQHQGRFVTVLPKTRSEDAAFRALVAAGQVTWQPLWEKTDDEGEVIDRYSISTQPATTAEGYRLVWYHSQRKAELDALARAARIERALKELASLRDKLQSPRTRYRERAKVDAGGGRDPRLVRGRGMDRHPHRAADRGDVSPGPARAAHPGHART